MKRILFAVVSLSAGIACATSDQLTKPVRIMAPVSASYSSAADARIDQSSQGGFNCSSSVDPTGYRLFQTFTVGLTGSLDHVLLNLFAGSAQGTAVVTIYPLLADGTPNFLLPLASGTITVAAVNAANGVPVADLSAAGLAVTAGTQLAIVLSSTDAIFGWIGGYSFYPGGRGSIIYPSGEVFDSCNDFYFLTYVVPPPGITRVGSSIDVIPVDPATGAAPATPIALTFATVTAPGTTTVSSTQSGPAPPLAFKMGTPPVYYDLQTTATYSGGVDLCFGYDASSFSKPGNVRLFHGNPDGGWTDVTTINIVDGTASKICGTVNSLSPFILAELHYDFVGFFQPVENKVVNILKAGSAVPIKFSLGGNYGLNVFSTQSPFSSAYTCGGGMESFVEETVSAGGSGLTYDATTEQYTYVWKTDKAWAGTCRKLTVNFRDGSSNQALFKLR